MPTAEDPILHAGLIARRQAGDWLGVLIEGPSGSGKSTLALAAMGQGFLLVADDRVEVWRSGEEAYGAAPAPLRGLIEVRGAMVMETRRRAFAPITLVVRLTPLAELERIPEAETREIAGLALPLIRLPANHPASAFRLGALVAAVQRKV